MMLLAPLQPSQVLDARDKSRDRGIATETFEGLS